MGTGVCWLLVSHGILVLAAVIPLPASSTGWCFSSRQAEQKQAGSLGTGAEGAAEEGAGKGSFGV